MFATDDDIIAVAHVTKEFTFVDPLSDGESLALIQTAEADGINVTVTASGRIVLIGTEDLPVATALLAEIGLIESLALIREITEWDIIGLVEDYPINFTFKPEGNDNDKA